MPLYAGFDLGGTRLKYGLVDERGVPSFQGQTATPASAGDLIRLLQTLWTRLMKKAKPSIRAAGFGFPGIFSAAEQKILQSPNYPDIDRYDLRPRMSEFIDRPFWINNDANMAAYGEFCCGGGAGAQSLVLLTIGTGIGTGLILGGRLWEGACGFAGELGHATIKPDGDRCSCGNRGCLETEVSGPKIVKNYKALSRCTGNVTSEDVYRRAAKGERAAREAFAAAGHALGIGLALAINLLNPEKILLGGGVMRAGRFLLPAARAEARDRSFKDSFDCCRIERARLGNKAGFIGAALWAVRKTSDSFF